MKSGLKMPRGFVSMLLGSQINAHRRNFYITSDLSATPFDPSKLANLALWLDASDSATITQVANAVSQWNDKSGNSNNVTQGTGANQPVTNSFTINSLNAISFTSSKSMAVPSEMYSYTNGANTSFFVHKNNVTTGTGQSMFTADAMGSRRTNIFLNPGISTIGFVNRVGSSAGGTLSYTPDTKPHIVASSYDAAGNINGWLDGSGYTGSSASQSSYISTDFTLCSFQGTSNFLNGLIAEICLYTRALSNSEINQ
ncbi:MAG: hypothetical protein ACREGF_01460, partial [Candidatus Saccharimonadales bacterium]